MCYNHYKCEDFEKDYNVCLERGYCYYARVERGADQPQCSWDITNESSGDIVVAEKGNKTSALFCLIDCDAFLVTYSSRCKR